MMNNVHPPQLWTCCDCAAENPAEADQCTTCGLRRSETDNLRRQEELTWRPQEREKTASVTLVEILLLGGLQLIGGLLFLMSWEAGTIYALIVIPILGATILRVVWYRRHGTALPFKERLQTVAGNVLILVICVTVILPILAAFVFAWTSYLMGWD